MPGVKDYAQMSDEQLDVANNLLEKDKDVIREEQRKIRDARSLKAAIKKVEAMTDSEKAVLKQVISGAGGIEGKAEVGTPGA